MMNLEGKTVTAPEDLNALCNEDKWILSRLNTVIRDVTENMDKYELGIAVQKVYDFLWDELCDWYIEMAKVRLWKAEENPHCADTGTEASSSVHAVYHRRDLLHTASGGRVHHDLRLAGIQRRDGFCRC